MIIQYLNPVLEELYSMEIYACDTERKKRNRVLEELYSMEMEKIETPNFEIFEF